MAKFSAITNAVKSLTEVETRFGLRRNDEPEFFSEWQGELPELTESEMAALARMGSSLGLPSWRWRTG